MAAREKNDKVVDSNYEYQSVKQENPIFPLFENIKVLDSPTFCLPNTISQEIQISTKIECPIPISITARISNGLKQ